MSLTAPARCGLALLLLSSACLAQSKPAADTPPTSRPATAKPKLTPEQVRGLRLLKASEGEAAGLQPEMRAFVLWQVSHGYSKVLPDKSLATLLDAFQVTEAIDSDTPPDGCAWEVCHMKSYLQRHLAEELLSRCEARGKFDEVEQLLPRLEPKVREEMVDRLIIEYAEKDQFPSAIALLNQIDDDRYYPYYAAEALMLRDPHPEDRLSIFTQAVSRFRAQPDAQPDSYDLATLVMRFSRDLPSTAVLDAIDQILARAKDEDEDQKQRVGINSQAGSVYFDSRYQFRLFQLLPVLEDLDKAKAEGLLRDNAPLGKAFDKFPKGPQSMDPKAYGDTPLPKGDYAVAPEVDVVDDKDPNEAAYQALAPIELKLQKIFGEEEKDPQQAYQDAQELPVKGPMGDTFPSRAEALASIAKSSIKKDPALARTAMNDMRKLIGDLDIAIQARFLTVVPNFYVEVGDMEEARNSIRDLMKLADKLYARDTDSSDPNLLFKGFWPATALWRRCVEYSAKVSPEFAEEMLAQIPDAEIQSFARVNYAASLAGAERFNAANIEWHKGGRHAGVMF
jgi:hypothetical protein